MKAQVINDRGESIARIRVLDDSHPVYVSLGKGAEMGTMLTVSEAQRLIRALTQAVQEAQEQQP